MSVRAQHITFLGCAAACLGLAVLSIISVVQSAFKWNSGPLKTTFPLGVGIGLIAFYVGCAGLLLVINSITGEQANGLTITRGGCEFYYPSGRVLIRKWSDSRALTVRQYRFSGGQVRTERKIIYCGGDVRAFLTPEALVLICQSAVNAGTAIRRWETTFPAHQSWVRIGGQTPRW